MSTGRPSHPGLATEPDAIAWRTSSRSQTTNCVEVAAVTVEAAAVAGRVDAVIAVRDSKNPSGPVLVFSRSDWRAFLAGAKDGEFDLN